nr:hypothetical protein Itr_chr08CG12870 [Ipomoea trifida]
MQWRSTVTSADQRSSVVAPSASNNGRSGGALTARRGLRWRLAAATVSINALSFPCFRRSFHDGQRLR